MNDDLIGFVQAIRDRSWMAIFGFGVTLLIVLWRRWAPYVFDAIPKRFQWVPAVVLTGATAFVAAWQSGASWDVAVAVTVWSMMVGGTAAVGLHRVVKETKNGAAVLLLVGATALVSTTGCAAVRKHAQTIDDAARILCELAPGVDVEAEKAGLTIQQFCALKDVIAPFILQAQEAQAAGAAAAGFAPPPPEADAGG